MYLPPLTNIPRQFFICLLMASLGVLSACSKPAPDDLTSIAGHTVAGVQGQGSDRLVFQTRNRVVNQLATDAYNIFRELKDHFPQEYRAHPEIAVEALSDLENQAGESFRDEPIFVVVWNRGDLDIIDFNANVGVFTENVLAAAKSVKSFNLAGDLVLMDHCMVGGGGEKREVFCNKVLEGLHVK